MRDTFLLDVVDIFVCVRHFSGCVIFAIGVSLGAYILFAKLSPPHCSIFKVIEGILYLTTNLGV